MVISTYGDYGWISDGQPFYAVFLCWIHGLDGINAIGIFHNISNTPRVCENSDRNIKAFPPPIVSDGKT